jgi:hypothetical protein
MTIRTAATIVTPPTSEPVTLAEVKLWMRIDTNDEDALILNLLKAARESAEKYLRRALITQTWNLSIDVPSSSLDLNLPDGVYDLPITALMGVLPSSVELPYAPLQSITSVVTYDTSNASTTYSSANYFADTANSRLALNNTASWPSNLRQSAAVVITYVCGYGTAAQVPQAIKMAIMAHAQKMYDERTLCDLPADAVSSLRQFRIYG